MTPLDRKKSLSYLIQTFKLQRQPLQKILNLNKEFAEVRMLFYFNNMLYTVCVQKNVFLNLKDGQIFQVSRITFGH